MGNSVNQYEKAQGRIDITRYELAAALENENLTVEQRETLQEQLDILDGYGQAGRDGKRNKKLSNLNAKINAADDTAREILDAISAVAEGPTTLNVASAQLAADAADGEWMSGSDLNRLAITDPDAFKEYWDGLEDGDRQAAQIQMQNASAAQMQTTTLISTLLKNQHEAAMTVIRNLAV